MGTVVETAVRQDERVDWSDDNRERLEVALTESDVVGVRLSAIEGEAVDVLLHVLALPESGPVENDPRRMLRFCGVDDVSVLLRRVTSDRARAGASPLRRQGLRLARARPARLPVPRPR